MLCVYCVDKEWWKIINASFKWKRGKIEIGGGGKNMIFDVAPHSFILKNKKDVYRICPERADTNGHTITL